MPTLPPLQTFLTGWDSGADRRAKDQALQLGQLQQLGVLSQLQQRMIAAQRDAAMRSELGALGPNPTQEALAGVTAKYASAGDILKSQTSSLDRKAQQQTAMLQFAQNLQLRQDDLDRKREEFSQRTTDTQAKQKFEEWYKTESLKNQQHMNALNMSLKSMGLDIQRQGLELRRDVQADKRDKAQEEKDASVTNISSNMDRLAQEANRLLNHPGLSKSTGLMSIVPLAGGLATVPGTDVANFKAGLETLKSQAGFSVLQAMRDASKTGGALGQVSDFENKMLQANLAALDTAQSEKEFKNALQKIITYTDAAKGRIKNAAKGKLAAPAKPTTPSVDDLLEKYK